MLAKPYRRRFIASIDRWNVMRRVSIRFASWVMKYIRCVHRRLLDIVSNGDRQVDRRVRV